METINFTTFSPEALEALNFDSLLDTTVAKDSKPLASVDLSSVTLEEVKQAVENYANLLTAQEGFKKTRSRIPAFSFGTDCSMPAVGKAIVTKMLLAGVWPTDNKGKPLNVVKARQSIAGKLYNRLYSLTSQRGVTHMFHENGTDKPFIKIVGKKDLEELQAMYTILNPELSEEEVEEAVKTASPNQRRMIAVDYLALEATPLSDPDVTE